jgi:hypothetical protein
VTGRGLKDRKILEINNFPIHLEIYNSEIIIKDENDNSIRITKKNNQSIILKLKGIFTTWK